MKSELLAINRTTFAKAILFGHIINILIGIATFAIAHWVFGNSVELSVFYTVVSTLLGSIIVSIVGTNKFTQPVSQLGEKINSLNEQINSSIASTAELQASQNALLENMPIGLLIFNQKTELVKSNQLGLKLLGFTSTENVLPAEPSTQQILDVINSLKSNGSPINFIDWLHQAKSDKIQDFKRWPMVIIEQGESKVACDLLAHYNKNDSHNYELVIMLIDRTEEYDFQEKQMGFISLAAHELRGPITVMRGLVDIFDDELKSRLTADEQELITRMAVSARQLAGYVDNILNVSRVDRDSFDVHPAEENWITILSQAIEEMNIRARAHHRKLELHVPKELPTVAVDTTAIGHVINNLVDNAIKYSKEDGVVMVNVKIKDSTIETTVQDFGIGIPANVMNNLFTKFYRSHRSKQIVSGTGLGLYLCKAIIEAHGGNIWVRSTEGIGTTFGFTLPTYASVAQQLESGHNEQAGIIRNSHGWIKNHALYRR